MNFFNKINYRIAGWSSNKDKQISNILHIGDELVEIGGTKVKNLEQLSSLLYSSSALGAPVSQWSLFALFVYPFNRLSSNSNKSFHE